MLWGLQAQSDSLLQQLDQLGREDLFLDDSLLIKTQVAAASKSLQDIADLPFTIFVIPRSEIISQGYITLADALESMPGIRVSQPGSALEGETFTMRGLLGNAYAKILINGNPVKPYVVSGMPIGAQLPIQQAERIEVIYGPSAALYGADASAGIINIVMADSERPVFTKASLYIGSDNYKSLNLLFGGKLGRDKNVVRFRFFGTDTRFDDRRIFSASNILYNPLNYLNPNADTSDVLDDRNYRGTDTAIIIQNTPHESRSLGGEIKYRFLTLSVMSMDRSDHSSIGLNPTAVVYANPLIRTGENITSAVLKSQFNLKNLFSETRLEYLGYELDNRSASLYVHPILNSLLYNAITDTANGVIIRNQIEEAFFSGLRFMGAWSNEWSIEQTFNVPIFKRGNLTGGAKYLRGNGSALRELQSRVVNPDTEEVPNLSPSFSEQSISEFSVFAQIFQPMGDKFNLLAGGQYLNRTNGDFAAPISVFNPRLALLYKLTKDVQLRASYSTAIRAPSPYFSATTYTYELGNYQNLVTGAVQLEAEKTAAYEIGMRWNNQRNLSLDVNLSYTNTDQFINYNIAFDSLGPDRRLSGFTLGYFNDENSAADLLDFQVYLRLKNMVPSLKMGGTFGFNYSRGTESLTTTNLQNLDNEIRVLEDVRGHPRIISRLSVFASPIERLLIRADQYLVSRSLTRNSFRLNAPERPEQEPNFYNPGYYAIDLSVNYQVNKNFLLYAKAFNLSNAQYAGIDASSSADILFFNPQSSFTFRFGINYELN